ncbi:hypothetical protein Tco_0493837 [Tanacetum coccineum]
MATLTFADSHNMVAYLEKSKANADFAEIVDFLNASSIRYTLTINKTIVISESSVRSESFTYDDDEMLVLLCLTNTEIFEKQLQFERAMRKALLMIKLTFPKPSFPLNGSYMLLIRLSMRMSGKDMWTNGLPYYYSVRCRVGQWCQEALPIGGTIAAIQDMVNRVLSFGIKKLKNASQNKVVEEEKSRSPQLREVISKLCLTLKLSKARVEDENVSFCKEKETKNSYSNAALIEERDTIEARIVAEAH